MAELSNITGIIVVALDGSRPARNAAGIAIQIAQHQNYTIHGLYIADKLLISSPYANRQAELRDFSTLSAFDDREGLDQTEWMALFKEQGDQESMWLTKVCTDANVLVAYDIVFSGVTDLLEERAQKATLLALGRRGNRHGEDPTHLGRHFRTTAHHTSTPLLVGGDEIKTIHRLLLVYDGGVRAQSALTWASILQRTLTAEVVVVPIGNDKKAVEKERYQQQVMSHLTPNERGSYQFLDPCNRDSKQIIATADEQQVDLILMSGYKHQTALLEWLSGSVLDEVLKHTPLPVLLA